ncbi:MAG: hypothetical protein HY291_11495 [Planctomycetes bacterium]|nr:hypothetical protein [Planctomycetota bacterium]
MLKPSMVDSRGVARCPICGNCAHFLVLSATVHVRPMTQVGAGRWTIQRPTPKKFEPLVPLLLLCDSCAHPLGAPTQALLRRLQRAHGKPRKKR